MRGKTPEKGFRKGSRGSERFRMVQGSEKVQKRFKDAQMHSEPLNPFSEPLF
jgi:hypothetical protein